MRFGKLYNDTRVIKAKGKQENGGAGMMLLCFNMKLVAAQWLCFGFPLVILQLQISMQVIP